MVRAGSERRQHLRTAPARPDVRAELEHQRAPLLEQAAALGDAAAMAMLATSALRAHNRDEALAWAEKAGAASKEEDFHKLVLTYEERLLRYIGRQGALPSASRAGFECLVRMGKAGSWVLWRSKALWRRVRRP